jgi:hypothetical protein
MLQLRQTYLRILHRKLAAAGSAHADYANFRRVLGKVKLFSVMLEIFQS